jgi:hypothetical protein
MDQPSPSPETDSILHALEQAQRFAKKNQEEITTAYLTPGEFLQLHKELDAEKRVVTYAEASALALFIGATKIEVEFDDDKVRQLFRSAFIIYASYGQTCKAPTMCAHDACSASIGSWRASSEALESWR